MDIRYKRFDYFNNKQSIKRIYNQSFPKNERFPFWILRHCGKNHNVELDAILCDEALVGMQFMVKYDDISYLMYFAIDENYRGLGIGREALRNLVIREDNVLLCIEKPCAADDVKTRRKSFYLRNGFYETGCCIEDTGVEYEVLSSIRNFKVNESVLRKRYTEMSSNFLIRYIIRRTFDVDSISFVRNS